MTTQAAQVQVIGVSETEFTKEDAKLNILFTSFMLIAFIISIFSLVSSRLSPVPRLATWYSFMLSWAIMSTSYLLLFFAGYLNNPQPPVGLCIIQSSLTFACPPLAAASSLSVVIQLFLNVRSTITGRTMSPSVEKRCLIAALAFPYMVFGVVVIESLAFALSHPNPSFSTSAYCSLENHIPTRISTALLYVFVIPLILLNIWLIFLVKNQLQKFKGATAYFSMFVRLTIFTVFSFFTLIIGLVFWVVIFEDYNQHALAIINLVLSTIPLAAVTVFGSHKDLIEVWFFWKRRKSQSPYQNESSPPIWKRNLNRGLRTGTTMTNNTTMSYSNTSIGTILAHPGTVAGVGNGPGRIRTIDLDMSSNGTRRLQTGSSFDCDDEDRDDVKELLEV